MTFGMDTHKPFGIKPWDAQKTQWDKGGIQVGYKRNSQCGINRHPKGDGISHDQKGTQ